MKFNVHYRYCGWLCKDAAVMITYPCSCLLNIAVCCPLSGPTEWAINSQLIRGILSSWHNLPRGYSNNTAYKQQSRLEWCSNCFATKSNTELDWKVKWSINILPHSCHRRYNWYCILVWSKTCPGHNKLCSTRDGWSNGSVQSARPMSRYLPKQNKQKQTN